MLTSDGLCTEIVVNNKHIECLEINGTSPTGGRVEIDSEGKEIIATNLIINGFTCNYPVKGKAKCQTA